MSAANILNVEITLCAFRLQIKMINLQHQAKLNSEHMR